MDEQRIKAVEHMLAESGVTEILLSVDAFHQETIPLEPVKFFAECVLRGNGRNHESLFRLNLRKIIGKKGE